MNSTLTAWEQEAFPHRRSSGKEARSWLLLVFAASVGDGEFRQACQNNSWDCLASLFCFEK